MKVDPLSATECKVNHPKKRILLKRNGFFLYEKRPANNNSILILKDSKNVDRSICDLGREKEKEKKP